MVKLGILDADSPMAGEIIRILINHPETEIVSLVAPSQLGRSVTAVHHGLIGEMQMNFSENFSPESLDILLLPNNNDLSKNIIKKLKDEEKIKLISLNQDNFSGINTEKFELGLSEINRKALVRGARMAFIPSSVVATSLIALIPLARFLLLHSDINIDIDLPEDVASAINIEKDKILIREELCKVQASFKDNVNFTIRTHNSLERGITVVINLQNNLDIEEIEKIYDEIYDDHNFTFLTRKDITPEEAEGTQKVLINIEKPESDKLRIKVVADSRLRGGAGDVVHVLNLFFGLHEKTGLSLKPSSFRSQNSF